MSLDCHIRAALLSDLPHLSGIERAACALFPEGRIPDPNSTLPQAILNDALEQDLLFVATIQGQLAGFALCLLHGQFLHLDELSVDPQFGRQGLGRSLVEQTICIYSERGLRGETLTTFSDLPWNEPFYQSLGFHRLTEFVISSELRARLREESDAGMTKRVAMLHSAKTR